MVAEHRGGGAEVLSSLADALCAAPKGFAKEAAVAVLTVTEEQASKFPASVHTLLLLLSGIAEGDSDLDTAAGYHAKASQVCVDARAVEDREKIETLLKAASLHVAIGKPSEASRLLQDCKIKVKSQFKPSQKQMYNQVNAKVLDHEGNYTLAARVHLQVAQDRAALQAGQITAAAQLEALSCAACSALVSESGERKDEVLQMLVKDERLDSVSCAALVHKAEKNRLLRGDDVAALKAALGAHQQSSVGTAVAEHNLVAARNLYKNISTTELAALLHVDSKTAEKTAAKMISDGRLVATISQVTHSVTFTVRKDDTAADDQIEEICEEVQDLQAKVRAA